MVFFSVLDEDGFLVNTMNGSDIKLLGGKLLPSKLEMIPAEKPGQKTVLIYENLKFNEPIEDNFFTVRNMSKLR